MVEYRYDKNRKSVHEICKVLGYRLITFDPNWTIASTDEKSPSSLLEAMSNQVTGKYDNIPDEFMGRIALLMGLEWKFPVADKQLEQFISDSKGRLKDVEQRMGKMVNVANLCDCEGTEESVINLKDEISEYIEETKTECEKNIKLFESKIKLREGIRKWKKGE